MAGSVLSVRSVAILSTLTLAASMASSLGAVASASYEICRQVWMFAAMSLDALAVAAQCMVAAALKTEAKATATATNSTSDAITTAVTSPSNGGISSSRALCNRLLQVSFELIDQSVHV
jgi:Na+-driven multidrug efflux pump